MGSAYQQRGGYKENKVRRSIGMEKMFAEV